MATLAQWEGGSLPAVTGSGVTLDTETGHPAAPSIAVAQQAGAEAFASWTFGAVPQAAVRFWLRTPSAWGSSAAIIATLGGAAVSESRIYLAGTGTPGQVRLYRSGTQIAASANGTIALNTWYRFELHIDAATQQARVGVFPASGTTPLWDSGWISDASLSASVTTLKVGRIGVSPTLAPIRLDSVWATDDVSAWIGEGSPDPVDPPTSAVFVKDGAAAAPTTAAWTAAWVKDGSAAVPV